MPIRIDAQSDRVYRPHQGTGTLRAGALLALATVLTACGPHAPPATPAPGGTAVRAPAAPPVQGATKATATQTALPENGAGPAAVEIERAAVAAAALPATPLRLVYSWSLLDRDAKFSGQAATRVQPPDRARLDLFGPRGEGYLSAALVGSDLRVPTSLQERASLVPAPPLLWTTLGVLRPPADARLTDARRSGDETRLEYVRGNERWKFTVVGRSVRHAEMQPAGGGRYTVDLKGDGARGLPKQAVYRDYAAFRELTLTLDRADEAQPFPPDTWSPGGP